MASGGPYLDQISGGSMTDYRSLAPHKRLLQQPVTMPDLSHTGVGGLAISNAGDQPKTTSGTRAEIRLASRALEDLAKQEQRELVEEKKRRRQRHRRRWRAPESRAARTAGSFMTQGRASVEELTPSEFEAAIEEENSTENVSMFSHQSAVDK
jgi:hypothetical protein